MFLMIAAGCLTVSKGEPDADGYIEGLPTNPILKEMSVILRCTVFDLNGNTQARLNGTFCRLRDDGSHIADAGMAIAAYDPKVTELWRRDYFLPHHQVVLSEKSSNILILSNEVNVIDGKNYRHDQLTILNSQGQELHNLNFENILDQAEEKFGQKKKPFTEAFWIAKYLDRKKVYFENSHVNSFYEIWDQKNESVQGYVVNCYYQQKIYFLDQSLKKLLRVIDMAGRKIHDVQLFGNKLYYYVNSDESRAKPWQSYLASYDLTTDRQAVEYDPHDDQYSSNACGSVQILNSNLFVIFHSNCTPTADTTSVARLEIVDTSEKRRKRISFNPKQFGNNAYLFKSKSFLSNYHGL